MPETFSHRAVYQRLARALAHDQQIIRTCRLRSRGYSFVGRHYVMNDRSIIVATHVDIADMARRAGVIGADDVVVEVEGR